MPISLKSLLLLVLISASSSALASDEALEPEMSYAPVALSAKPAQRDSTLPRARWEHRLNGELWTRVALAAVKTHGAPLLDVVPKDIAEWCPAYPDQGRNERAAFWASLLSTLSRYESTWNPRAVGGGNLWFGLLQIYPPTVEFRDCRVQTGEGLKHASANLNCAVRIMAITVPRDQAISTKDARWRGVAADWGPIRTAWMRNDMQRYTRRQTYCRLLSEVRPQQRPGDQAALAE